MTKDIVDAQNRMKEKKKEKLVKVIGKPTPWPAEARPNPFLAKTFEDFNAHLTPIATYNNVHQKGIGGGAIHIKKDVLATVSDDCTWKVWNLGNGELLMSAEGHKDWVSGVDFHPAGSHLVTSSNDKTIKVILLFKDINNH